MTGRGGASLLWWQNVASFKAHILPQMMPVFEPGPVKADIRSVEVSDQFVGPLRS